MILKQPPNRKINNLSSHSNKLQNTEQNLMAN